MSAAAERGKAAPDRSGTLRDLLRADTPFIDLRAPKEFARGAVPGAVNLPLLDDNERHQVGLRYRESGQAAAVALGHELVNGAVKRARIDGWLRFAQQHSDAWLYCWRGGLRSEIAQQWLADSGAKLPRVPGGFKALRGECLAALEEAPGNRRWLVVGGRTGSGKTRLLERLACSIDLEGLANHRGSAFGGRPGGQPTPVDFENALAVCYLRHQGPLLVLEDESRTIGRLALPSSWHEAMQQSALAILETPLEERVRNIFEEYVNAPLTRGMEPAALEQQLEQSLARIRRRLGGQRHDEVRAALADGFKSGRHERWIALLLSWYYDPMYDYQLEQKRDRVVASGDADSLLQQINRMADAPPTGQ
jgi:tRNA 2-selenouridine synthase